MIQESVEDLPPGLKYQRVLVRTGHRVYQERVGSDQFRVAPAGHGLVRRNEYRLGWRAARDPGDCRVPHFGAVLPSARKAYHVRDIARLQIQGLVARDFQAAPGIPDVSRSAGVRQCHDAAHPHLLPRGVLGEEAEHLSREAYPERSKVRSRRHHPKMLWRGT
jgi:hypothetical protein